MTEEYFPEENIGRSFVRELYDWIEAFVLAVVCAVLIFTFLVRIVGVYGSSMNPTLQDQDRLIITRLFYEPSQGDIVVVTKPNSRDEPLIKRVIATEGQLIDIDFPNGVVYVNGREIQERYIAEKTHLGYDMEFPQEVPPGHVFVMGDNRNASWDSRATEIGMVDQRYILGRVIYRVLPYHKMGNPNR